MLRIRKFGENRSAYNAALLEFVDLVLRGFAGIGFRQGYADSAASDAKRSAYQMLDST